MPSFESPLLWRDLHQIEPGADFTGKIPRLKSSSGKVYFVKTGSPSEKDQYAGEAESLRQIFIASPGLCPMLLFFGIETTGHPYFVSEYRNIGSLSSATGALLGKRLATELHCHTSPRGYGFEIPTYCGATRLENGWFDNWSECFSSMIGNLLQQLEVSGKYHSLCLKGMEIRQL